MTADEFVDWVFAHRPALIVASMLYMAGGLLLMAAVFWFLFGSSDLLFG